MRRNRPSACAILVAHDSAALLPSAVEGLRKHAGEMELKIVVVDCGSTDRSAEVARELAVDEVVETGNLGYGAGNNLGSRTETAKGCEWLVLVNPDTRPIDGSIASLLDVTGDKGASIASPAFATSADPTAREPSLLPSPRIDPRRVARALVRGQVDFEEMSELTPVDESVMEIEGGIGAFLVVRRGWFERLGGFDDRFFLYGEEVDLQLRSRELGGAHIASDSLVVVHEREVETDPPAIQAQYFIARLVLRLKLGGRPMLTLTRASLVVSVLRRWWSWPGGREARNACFRSCFTRLPSDPSRQRAIQANRLGKGAR